MKERPFPAVSLTKTMAVFFFVRTSLSAIQIGNGTKTKKMLGLKVVFNVTFIYTNSERIE